jgi:hypothetical protein
MKERVKRGSGGTARRPPTLVNGTVARVVGMCVSVKAKRPIPSVSWAREGVRMLRPNNRLFCQNHAMETHALFDLQLTPRTAGSLKQAGFEPECPGHSFITYAPFSA